MAQITIGDLTGSAQIDVPGNSLVGKSQLTALTTAASDVIAALPKPVTDASFQGAKFSAAFDKPSIPFKGNKVEIKASVNSTLSVARAADSPLFGKDNYDSVDINNKECWVGFELDTMLDANVAIPLPNGFGVSFEASSAPSFATYILIPDAQAPNTSLEAAISNSLKSFEILGSSADVLSIPKDTIYTNDLSGTVTVGGSWALPLAVNQLSLADAKLPFNSSVSVSPAVTIKVGGSIAITSEFSVRFRRSAPNLVRIGLYKKKGTTLAASFKAGAGVRANLGNTDLIKAFFSAVDPTIDTSVLQPGESAKIKQVLSDSLDRSLAISLNAACSAAFSDEAAMVYEVDVTAQDQATKDAVDQALGGDWTGISTLPNARKIRNVITETVEKKFTVNVNFLGLYNYRSVADFVRSMQVITNLEDGSVVITDSVTAKNIVTASTPLAADPDRLRAALYEGFLATATYKALLAGVGAAATFGATQDLLIYHDSMGYRDALKQLNAGQELGVLPASVRGGLPAVGAAVHHARFAASCTYSNDDVQRFFFTDIQAFTPRTSVDLKKIGRSVLAGLLTPRIRSTSSESPSWRAINSGP
jgi:hypothetical protein